MVVKCENLRKYFGKVTALEDIELELDKNKVYGLLGRNGAGKTTFLDLLTGNKLPDEGIVKIFDQPIYGNQNLQEQICYIEEESNYPPKWTVKNLLKVSKFFHPSWDTKYAERLCAEFEINIKRQYQKMSQGKKAVVNIVVGLASRCPLTIFDESYMGLDTPSRQKFYDLLLEDFREHPRTIIFSTHLIDEVYKLFDSVIIIEQGQLLLHEEADNIRERAFLVMGKEEIVNNLFSEEEVIHREEKMGFLQLAVYTEIGKERSSQINSQEVEIKNISLAEFFTFFTENKRRDR